MRKEAFVLIALSISLIFFIPMVLASTESVILPSADAYVAQAKPGVNAGSDIYLYTYNWQNVTNFVYIKYDFSSIPNNANITSITLRMHEAGLYTSTPATIGAFICTDNSWEESTLTYDNAPTCSSTPSATVEIDTSGYGFGMVGADYNFDLTGALSGKSEVTLVLKTMNNSWSPATFSSKEGNYPPKLIVNYDIPSSIDTSLVAAAGIGTVVVLVAVVVTLRRRQRKKIGKQQTASPDKNATNSVS